MSSLCKFKYRVRIFSRLISIELRYLLRLVLEISIKQVLLQHFYCYFRLLSQLYHVYLNFFWFNKLFSGIDTKKNLNV